MYPCSLHSNMHAKRKYQFSRALAHSVIANLPTPIPLTQMSAAAAAASAPESSKIAKYLNEDHGKAVITTLLSAGMAKSAIYSMLDDNAVFGDEFYALMTKLKLNPTTKWHNAIKAFEAWEDWVLTQEDYWVDLVEDSEDGDSDDDECEEDDEEDEIMDILDSAAPAKAPPAPPASAASKRKADELDEEIEVPVPHPKKAKLLKEVQELSVAEITAMLEAAKAKQSEKERQAQLQQDLAAAAPEEEEDELRSCTGCDECIERGHCEKDEETAFTPRMNKEQWVFLLKMQKSGLYNMLDQAVLDKLKVKFGLTTCEAESIHLEYFKYDKLAAHFGCGLKDM